MASVKTKPKTKTEARAENKRPLPRPAQSAPPSAGQIHRSRRTIDMSRPDDIVNYGTGARLRAVVISLSSLAALMAIVAGVPALLVRFIGNPLPNGVPGWTVIRAHLEAGAIPTPAIVSLLTMLAWALWLSISLPIIAELISAFRGVATPRIALSFPGSAVLARRLVAGLFVISTSVSSIAAAAPALAAVAVAPQELIADSYVRGAMDPTADTDVNSLVEVPRADPLQRYIVGPGETLRSIAEETLGDANRWKEVRMVSVGVVQPDGSQLPEDIIRVTEGTVLHLPSDAVSASGEPLGAVEAAAVLGSPSSTSATRTITVAKGNHFWELAERTLTDAWGRSPTDVEITPYWAQVVEQNADRLVRPGDPNLIFPDQQFLLPPVPADELGSGADEQAVDIAALRAVLAMLPDTAPASAPSGVAAPTAAPVDVPVGDHGAPQAAPSEAAHPMMAASGSSGLPVAAMAPTVVGSVGADAISDRALGPDTARAPLKAGRVGERDDTPLAPGPATTPAASTSIAPGEAADSGVAGSAADADGSVDLSRWIIGGVGAGLLAAALTQALVRRRRRQWQERAAGRMPAPVSPGAQAFDASLRQTAAPDRLATAEAALRSLSPLLPTDAPAITTIAVSDNDVVLTLERFCEPPGLFTSVDDSPLWRLRTDDDATKAALAAGADNVAVLPALVTLGHDPASGSDILVDLEYVLALDVVGSEQSSAQFVRTLAAELAASPFAEDVDVICCGFGHELCGLRRVVLVDSVDEACAEARLRQADEDGSEGSPLERRLRQPGEGQTPVVLLTTQPVDDADRAKLRELSLHGVIVVAPGIDAKWSVALMPGGLRVEPLGLKLVRHDFSDDQFAALGELIEASDLTAPDVVPAPSERAARLDDAGRVADGGLTAGEESELDNVGAVCDIEVQVLGTVNISGADRDFSSARAIDVISYLAFHRDGANADMLKTWIWPIDEPPSDKAFANVMSRARKGLGTDDASQPYLARADVHGNYRLLPSVRSDVDQFERLVGRAEAAAVADDGRRSLELFQEALGLVRGVPFTGGGARGFLWADNGVRAQIEFSIDEAAHRCADVALAIGNLEVARAAAFRGLSVIPWCEGCYRRRFRVAAADGNRTELKSAMADLEAVLSADADEPEGSDLVGEQTLALYARLLRGPSADERAADGASVNDPAVTGSAAGG